jgi:hypothetical protein
MPKIYRTLELKSRIQNSKLKKMYVPFENLPEESKIWVYQSNRKFSDTEFSEIESALQAFLENGQHGTSLVSSYQLKYNRFIILAVDQDVQSATGCSIDASVEFIQSLEQNTKWIC